MIETLEEFVHSVENFDSLKLTKKCDYFVYFLIVFKKLPGVKPKDVEKCFTDLKIHRPSNIPRYLGDNTKKKPGSTSKFIKQKELYHLERKTQQALQSEVKVDKPFAETNKSLRSLSAHLTIKSEKDFLDEAIRAFEVEAFRAAVVMLWLLTLDHIFEYILSHKIKEFNAALSKVTDKRVKVSSITVKDDFSDIPEGKFIEICRSGGIISNDVRKILDEKLGTRNSAAHPSSVTIGKGKSFDFIEDLITNVILKY